MRPHGCVRMQQLDSALARLSAALGEAQWLSYLRWLVAVGRGEGVVVSTCACRTSLCGVAAPAGTTRAVAPGPHSFPPSVAVGACSAFVCFDFKALRTWLARAPCSHAACSGASYANRHEPVPIHPLCPLIRSNNIHITSHGLAHITYNQGGRAQKCWPEHSA